MKEDFRFEIHTYFSNILEYFSLIDTDILIVFIFFILYYFISRKTRITNKIDEFKNIKSFDDIDNSTIYKKYRPIIYVVIFIFGIYFGKYFVQPNKNQDNYSKIHMLLDLLQNNYVDGFDLKKYEEKIINSILNELDPHSAYSPAKEQIFNDENMQGSFSGIGVEFNIIRDSLIVVSPISGGPSEKLGIMSGDVIVEVDGQNFASVGITNDKVISTLRGKKGTEVSVMIYRKGEKSLINYVIVRGDIPLYSVDTYYMINDNTGYLKVNRFSANTINEFSSASESLLSQGMENLILDLRGNPGGYLSTAYYMANEFLESGEMIVYTEGKYTNRYEMISDNNGSMKNTRLAILIDYGSASASEIVSGCIQDLDRGVIIGRRSFGKGLVQEEIKLYDGSAVRITTQRYYIPSGRCIQKPYDINENEYHNQFIKEEDISDSLQYTTKNGRIVYGGGGITPDILINYDTLLNYTQYNKIRSKSWISEFSLSYNLGVNEINYNEISADAIFVEFMKFIKQQNIDLEIEMGDRELKDLKLYIKASVIRNISGKDEYYKIINSSDEFINEALDYFNRVE